MQSDCVITSRDTSRVAIHRRRYPRHGRVMNPIAFFQCGYPFHRPLPYWLLFKLHLLCTFPCTFTSKLKREHVRTTHVDLNEGINDNFNKEINYLLAQLLICHQSLQLGRENGAKVDMWKAIPDCSEADNKQKCYQSGDSLQRTLRRNFALEWNGQPRRCVADFCLNRNHFL